MNVNKLSPAAVIQVGIGIIGILMAGPTNSGSGRSPKGKRLSYLSTACLFAGSMIFVTTLIWM